MNYGTKLRKVIGLCNKRHKKTPPPAKKNAGENSRDNYAGLSRVYRGSFGYFWYLPTALMARRTNQSGVCLSSGVQR